MAVFFVFACLLTPFVPAFAEAGPFGIGEARPSALGDGNLITIITRIIDVALGLLGIIAVVIIVYAGYVIMTAGGDEQRVEEGKNLIRNGVIGLAIILSAYAIAHFIISQLGGATGAPGAVAGRRARDRGSFVGSGALGTIIGDHYPFRGESGVRRNSRIAVTFREPIDPASIAEDTNRNGTIGDCIDPGAAPFDWSVHCDQLNTSAIQIYPTESPNESPSERVNAALLALYEGNPGQVFTIVIRPINLLGNDISEVGYTINLTGDVLRVDGATSAFTGDRAGHYLWEFETSTEIDTDPPVVIGVYPRAGRTIPRNSIIQVEFSEAMDPSAVQGRIGPGSAFGQLIFGGAPITGNWRIANAYKTVEFVSDEPCGENSCGEVMYCLPAAPRVDVLVRTADIIDGSPGFEGIPFSGVMDMAGNALDGDEDDEPDGKPALPADVRTIGPGENAPDNYFWPFVVDNTIDRTAPIIRQMFPGLDAEEVPGDAPVEISFSGRMWVATLRDIAIQEHIATILQPIWFRATASTDAEDRTVADVDHREFGPDGEDAYYFPVIPSTVKSITQNCVYPGRGPVGNIRGASPLCDYAEDAEGNQVGGTGAACVPVTRSAVTDTGCVRTNPPNPEILLLPTAAECIDQLEQASHL